MGRDARPAGAPSGEAGGSRTGAASRLRPDARPPAAADDDFLASAVPSGLSRPRRAPAADPMSPYAGLRGGDSADRVRPTRAAYDLDGEAGTGLGVRAGRPARPETEPETASRWPVRPVRPGRPAGVTRQAPDYLVLLVVAALVAIGMVMVYSSSSVDGAVNYHDPAYFLKRQLAGLVVGGLALLFCMNWPYWNWRRFAPAMLVVTVVMLFLVLVPHVGIQVLGARRWLGYHSLRLQPSEIAKLSLIVFFADWLARAGPRLQNWRTGVLPFLVMIGVIFGLILAEPDLGTAAAITGTSLIMLFLAGVPILHLAATALAGVPVLAYAILGSSYRRARLFSFLNPQAHPLSSGYHIMQALYALGSGGLFGLGLGLSRQKYFYLPERHTDFIFAILGEELGLVGGLLLLGLFLVLIWRGYRIAVAAPDTFSSLLASGVTTMIAVQVVINIGVVTSVLPITGITLPFISFGSSSLVIVLAGMGILCNVSRYARL